MVTIQFRGVSNLIVTMATSLYRALSISVKVSDQVKLMQDYIYTASYDLMKGNATKHHVESLHHTSLVLARVTAGAK